MSLDPFAHKIKKRTGEEEEEEKLMTLFEQKLAFGLIWSTNLLCVWVAVKCAGKSELM